MEVLRVLALILGIFIVIKAGWSVFTALVVPRVTSSTAMRGVARFLGLLVRKISPHLPNYEVRDRVLSFVGPAAMVMLFVVWLGLLLVGYGLILWFASSTSFGTSMAIAGSSIFTLGIVSNPAPQDRLLEILASGTGLLVVALEIAYLPALYNAFATRETEVTLLATRSGTPAWGPEILARHHYLQTMDELPELYGNWERWAATVSESQSNYPALMWFRSPVSSRSWLVALVAMMDSAALYHSVSPQTTPHQARLFLSMGNNCLRAMARALDITYNADPLPEDGIRLTRAEFDEGYARLEGAHFALERDNEEAWRHFHGWRVNYEQIVDSLTRLVVPPPAPWFLDRPELGAIDWPVVRNRTPDDPNGVQTFGSSKTLSTPSPRESNNS
ncbi:MAG TPA: hypothetical protein VGG38_09895 [Acidimicrobiales bacterium]|jgi:hypothetical protein